MPMMPKKVHAKAGEDTMERTRHAGLEFPAQSARPPERRER